MSIACNQLEKLAVGHLIHDMQPVTETRLARLKMLVKKHNGSLADLNEAIGLVRTDATLSQIRTKAPHSKTGKQRVMGDDLARKIEDRLSLPVGWMDTPPSYAELNGEHDPRSQVMLAMESMSASEAYQALAVITALKSTPEPQATPEPEIKPKSHAFNDSGTLLLNHSHERLVINDGAGRRGRIKPREKDLLQKMANDREAGRKQMVAGMVANAMRPSTHSRSKK